VLVSNQDGLGTPKFSVEQFTAPHEFVMRSLANEGIIFIEELIDRSYPHENLATRKPGIGMFTNYLNNPEYDIPNSYVIGDRITDVQLAKNLGCKAMWINNHPGLGGAEVADSIEELRKVWRLKHRLERHLQLFKRREEKRQA
jgi:imidazoleglycerol-phosphate dehydratase/histidinol-phosphatase